jgi:hypothetical protein
MCLRVSYTFQMSSSLVHLRAGFLFPHLILWRHAITIAKTGNKVIFRKMSAIHFGRLSVNVPNHEFVLRVGPILLPRHWDLTSGLSWAFFIRLFSAPHVTKTVNKWNQSIKNNQKGEEAFCRVFWGEWPVEEKTEQTTLITLNNQQNRLGELVRAFQLYGLSKLNWSEERIRHEKR